MPIEEFQYRLGWRSRNPRPGAHPGRQRGVGLEFRGLVPLLATGDPRRLDLRASARDPFRQLLVRLYTQPSAIPIYALADLSASIGFRGAGRKLDVMADFITALGYSAFRVGDPVAVMGCDQQIRAELSRPLGRTRAAAQEVATRMRAFEPRCAGASALRDAAAVLPTRRALVFLISDFYLPLELIDDVLGLLAHHDVVPIVLRDSAELDLPRFGFARVRDAESGAQRSLLVRASLAGRLRARSRDHDRVLARHFAVAGARPITLIDRFDATLVTRHFYG
jgi:uncharacterized protein (DUF58 family)